MKPLTLIVSESEFLASVELDRLRARWVAKGYTVEDVSAEDPQALWYAIDTPSLFGDGRFVVVRGSAKEMDPLGDRLVAWATNPPPAIAVAIVVPSATKLKKTVAGKAEIIESVAPKPWETADWVARHVKGLGRTISKDAAAALVDAVGGDLRELATAAEQVAGSTSGSITVESVHRLFRGFETQLYTFLDALLRRDRSTALKHLAALMRSGTHPLQLINALSNQFRAVALARDTVRAPAATIAKELGVTVGYVNRAQKHATNFDAGEIRAAFRLLADADLALKGGERGEDQPNELTMELLVAQIAGDRPAVATARRR